LIADVYQRDDPGPFPGLNTTFRCSQPVDLSTTVIIATTESSEEVRDGIDLVAFVYGR